MSEPEEFLLQFFAYAHLPPHLAEISRPFADLAALVVATLPRNPERTTALRKLLEAKDCAVRARLARVADRPTDRRTDGPASSVPTPSTH